MTDVFTKEKRSEVMSRIHQPTRLEDTVHEWLAGQGIPHEMYPKVFGRPDIFVDGGKGSFYVFIDGCFWHCCPLHYRRPKSRQEFWIPHVEESNAKREELRKQLPYRWIRIWEHEVNDGSFKEKILRSLSVNSS